MKLLSAIVVEVAREHLIPDPDGGSTVVAEAGIGITDDDIYAYQPLLGLTAVDRMFSFPEGGTGVIATAGLTVKLDILVAATGTSQSIEVDVIGYEV